MLLVAALLPCCMLMLPILRCSCMTVLRDPRGAIPRGYSSSGLRVSYPRGRWPHWGNCESIPLGWTAVSVLHDACQQNIGGEATAPIQGTGGARSAVYAGEGSRQAAKRQMGHEMPALPAKARRHAAKRPRPYRAWVGHEVPALPAKAFRQRCMPACWPQLADTAHSCAEDPCTGALQDLISAIFCKANP
jgi:hypothetical protein